MAARRVTDLLLRITGDPAAARDALDNITDRLRRFGQQKVQAEVDVDTKPAETALERAKRELRDFGRLSEQAKVELQTAAAQAQLDRLKTRLENLAKQEASPKVDVKVAGTLAQIARVQAKLDELGRKRVDINVDVDRRGGLGRGLAAALGGLAETFGSVATGASKFFGTAVSGLPVLGRLGLAMGTLGASTAVAGAAMLALAPILIGAVLVGVTLLLGAVVALGASLLTAAAAVGVLGVALAAAFGPVLLVAIAAATRFAKILEAVKESEKKAADQARRVRDARQAQADAERNLGQAQQRVSDAAVEAYRAQADAAEEVEDAIRGIQDAELNRDQAALNVEKAEQNLKDLRSQLGLTSSSLDDLFEKFTDVDFRPENLIKAIRGSAVGAAAGGGSSDLDIAQAILDVRDARLQEKNATDAVGDAHTRLQRAQQRSAEFAREGIEAYEPYASALRGVEDAQRALADATDRTNLARKEQGEALKQLDPRERRLARVIEELKKSLTSAFRPATDAIFKGVLGALEEIDDFAKDSRVRGGLAAIGRAIGSTIGVLARELRRREVRDGFAEIARGAGGLIRILGTDVFRSVFRILLRIAREAMPVLLEFAEKVGDTFRGWERSADQSGIRGFVRRVINSFRDWLDLARAVRRLVMAFFGAAADAGDSLVRKIRHIVDGWADWLEQNPDKVRQFFSDAVGFAGRLVEFIDKAVRLMDDLISIARAGKDVWDVLAGPDQTEDFLKHQAQQGGDVGEAARRQLRALGVPGYSTGGVIRRVFGRGRGDTEPLWGEPGEFVIKRRIAQAIGIPRLDLLNSGRLDALAGATPGGAGGIHIEAINLPPAPGHDQLGDPRHQAVQLARELRRRGGQGLGGGGIQ